MEKKHSSYLSSDYYVLSEDFLNQIERSIDIEENILVEFMAGGGKSRFCSLFTTANTDHRCFVLLDQRLDLATCKELLNTHVQIHFQTNTLIEAITKLKKAKSVLYLVIDNFNFDNLELLNYLAYLRNLGAGAIRFILVANARVVATADLTIKGQYSFLLNNRVRFHYLESKKAQEFFHKSVQDLQVNWSAADLKLNIYDYCGGIPYLIKALVRVGQHFKGLKETFISKEYAAVIQVFWQRFSTEEKQIIKTYFFTGKLIHLPGITEMLTEYSVMQPGTKCGKWIEIATATVDEGQFQLVADRIHWDGVDFSEQFTNVETILLKSLIKKNGELLSKDEIVSDLWGENADSKYSAGAVDKTVSRLRSRFKELGLPVERLITMKGTGLKLDN